MKFHDIGEGPIFADCPESERQLLRSLVVPLRVKAGQDIVHQGDFGRTIGVILEGRASVWHDGKHVNDLEPGDCFGSSRSWRRRAITAIVRPACMRLPRFVSTRSTSAI